MSRKSKSGPEGTAKNDNSSADDSVISTAFWLSLTVFALLVPVVGGTVWFLNRPEIRATTDASKLIAPRPTDISGIPLPLVTFADITRSSGLDFQHFTGARGEKLLPETMGGGCAFCDYDNDGDQDIVFVNGCDWPWTKSPSEPQPTLKLFQNDGNGAFRDATIDSGLNVTFYGMGIAVGDYDGDGWVDIFVSSVGKDWLFHNENGHFKDVTAAAGVAGDEQAWGTSCCWFDFDNDDDLDLFVGNYVQWSREKDLALHSTLDGKQRAYGPPFQFDGSFPYLYRNDGNKFTEVSESCGLHVRNPDTGVPVSKAMGVVPVDVDDDGFLDLIVSNDTVQNFLFHNLGNGQFHEIASDAGIAYGERGLPRGAMGIDAARPRNDRSWTVAIGNFSNEMTGYYVAPKPMRFFDAANATGLGRATRLSLTFGILFVDYDLDGRLDLFCANGHLEESINKVQDTQFYAQPPRLYWNCGINSKPEFLTATADKIGEPFGERMVGRGSAFADIDNDGDLDLLIAGSGSAPRLLRNDNQLGHHWLRVKLKGTKGNRDAIGAALTLYVDGRAIPRYVNPCRGYLSSSELPVTFGLGTATAAERLEITWPDGQQQTLKSPEIDRLLTIEHPTR